MKQFGLQKSVSLGIKDLDDKGMVKFAFTNFGSIDSDGDIVAHGAIDKTIKEHFARIKHVKNHYRDELVGVPKEIYVEGDYGIMVSSLILGTQRGRDTYEEYKAGGITEHSWRLDVISDKMESGRRVIIEARMWEASSLTAWGANENTPVFDIKSKHDLMTEIDRLYDLKKGDFSDEFFKKLEAKISDLQKHIKALIEPQSGASGSPEGIQKAVKYFIENAKQL